MIEEKKKTGKKDSKPRKKAIRISLSLLIFFLIGAVFCVILSYFFVNKLLIPITLRSQAEEIRKDIESKISDIVTVKEESGVIVVQRTEGNSGSFQEAVRRENKKPDFLKGVFGLFAGRKNTEQDSASLIKKQKRLEGEFKKREAEFRKKEEEIRKKEEKNLKREMEVKKREENNQKKETEIKKKEEGKQKKETGSSQKEAAGKEKEAGITYQLKSVVVNLSGTGARRFLKATVVFEFTDKKFTKELEERGAQIYNLLIEILSRYTIDDICAPDGKEKLRSEIKEKTNVFFGSEKIKNVYFVELVIQ
jgi:flagellar protein FliL